MSYLVARSEPALLDLCGIDPSRGGPLAALIRGHHDPPRRFEPVAVGREPDRVVRVLPARGGGAIVALSSGVPDLPDFASCPRVAPDHLRHALSAGLLRAAIVSEAEAGALLDDGLVRQVDKVVGPALRPARLVVDTPWRRRDPATVVDHVSAWAAWALR